MISTCASSNQKKTKSIVNIHGLDVESFARGIIQQNVAITMTVRVIAAHYKEGERMSGIIITAICFLLVWSMCVVAGQDDEMHGRK